jgi:hypothetical protein
MKLARKAKARPSIASRERRLLLSSGLTQLFFILSCDSLSSLANKRAFDHLPRPQDLLRIAW